MEKKHIIFYTTPAHGHINPALPIISGLIEKGYRVTAYSTDEYKSLVESSGAVFQPYDMGDIKFDTSIGSELLLLTRLILQFTAYSSPGLIASAAKDPPALILHDTLALWGRLTADFLGIPAVSVNTIITTYGAGSRAFRMYSRNFALSTAPQLYALKDIRKNTARLKKLYGLQKTDMMNLLMNREGMNIFTFPRCRHPDGSRLGKDCFFAGNTSRLRSIKKGDLLDSDKLIYVSLGTVFNGSLPFYRELFRDLGETEYDVFVSCGKNYGRLSSLPHSSNIVLTSFADQRAVLERAKLFITAGGMNSLCEAAAAGVPMLMIPQQGEQKINAAMAERLGLGKICRGGLYEGSCDIMGSFRRNERMTDVFSTVRINELITSLEDYMKGNKL